VFFIVGDYSNSKLKDIPYKQTASTKITDKIKIKFSPFLG